MAMRVDGSSSTSNAAADAAKKRQAEQIKKMIEYALSQRGKDYVYGAEVRNGDANPEAWDCSELVEHAVRAAGGRIPDGSSAQNGATTRISVEQAIKTPGALLFSDGHVAISLGNGKTIEAMNSQKGVTIGNATPGRFSSGGLVKDFEEGYGNVPKIDPNSVEAQRPDGGSYSVNSGADGRSNEVEGGLTRHSDDEDSYSATMFRMALAQVLGGMNQSDLAGLLGMSLEALKAMTPAKLEKAVKAAEKEGKIPPGSADKIISAAKSGDAFNVPAGDAPMTIPSSSTGPASPAPVAGVPTFTAAPFSTAAGIPKGA